eukprot:TRINITY_DN8220_c0_g2_i1.p1 TRINITY_DN8220_c0_g2~~TRINITY_DN8220_c0_g2_i1.p1  ORF type:complete len:260 (+),score=52.88 TRINITY_DN8220_c0_g2_i1:1-780(+)
MGRCFSVLRRNQPFRLLSSFEQEAIRVADNRDFSAVPVNSVFLTCEHGSKEYCSRHCSLKHTVHSLKLKELSEGFRVYDPYAAECTLELSAATRCLACMCTFSRVVIDVDGSLLSQKLHSKLEHQGYFMEVFNSHERAGVYYGLYHGMVREVVNWICPEYHVSVHTRKLQGDVEIYYKGDLTACHQIVEKLTDRGIKASFKESLEFEMGINRMIELGDYNIKFIKSLRMIINEELAANEAQRKDFILNLSSTIHSILNL